MISYLKGKIIKLDLSFVTILLDSGIGYDIGINEITYSNIVLGEETELFIYHHITEGNQSLFGFLKEKEKDIFKELIKISGIGGKVALSILSLGITRLIIAVNDDDKKTIEQVKGIGKKMASKIILELKDKDFVKNFISLGKGEELSKSNLEKELYNQIKTTLVSMGYNSKDIERILDRLPEKITKTGEIIAYVIRNI